eukprot:Opistho-2@60802
MTTEDNYYLLSAVPLSDSKETGASNLLVKNGLADEYRKFCANRPNGPHLNDYAASVVDGDVIVSDKYSLRVIVDQPPIGGEVIKPLDTTRFTLKPGKIPDMELQRLGRDVHSRHKQKQSKHNDGSRRGDR